jgi:hypothetical protein
MLELVAQGRQIDYTTVSTFVLGLVTVTYFVGKKAFKERKHSMQEIQEKEE